MCRRWAEQSHKRGRVDEALRVQPTQGLRPMLCPAFMETTLLCGPSCTVQESNLTAMCILGIKDPVGKGLDLWAWIGCSEICWFVCHPVLNTATGCALPPPPSPDHVRRCARRCLLPWPPASVQAFACAW